MEKSELKKLLEPFDIAIRLEQEGKKVFVEAAENTSSRLARQTFEFLASEEDRHIDKIRRFRDQIEESGGSEFLETEDSDAEEKLKSFNDRLAEMRDDFKTTDSDAEAYKRAMEFENGAEEFYAEKMEEADNPRVKRFYKWLIDEEKMHARLLKSCLNFVEDPEAWFKTRRA